MISSRLSRIEESATLRLTKVAEDLKSKGVKVYNFGIGEPDFTTPETIIESAFEWARRGKTHYTPANGIRELREAIADKLLKKNQIHTNADNVLISPTKYAIYLSLYVILEEGDGVILPDPYYSSYKDIIKLAGGKVLDAPLNPDYSLNYDLMEKMVSPRTKAIIFNNPSNPTGRVYTQKEVKELVDFAIKNKLIIISDEIYEDLIYEGSMYSPGSIEEAADRVITINGFSKSYAMTGWRIGYLNAAPEITKAAAKVLGQTITCVSSISQYGALQALRDEKDPVAFREKFRKRRDLVIQLFSEIDGYSTVKPEGAFYAFPKYSGKKSSVDYAAVLLEKYQVIVTPGTAFGEMGELHYRFSYAASEEEIKEGISRIAKYDREI
jgi:aspartate aminotransferase